jgi:hypothetical protein
MLRKMIEEHRVMARGDPGSIVDTIPKVEALEVFKKNLQDLFRIKFVGIGMCSS